MPTTDDRSRLDEHFMREALREAEQARDEEEVPIGAVVVSPAREVIGRGHNQTEALGDVTAHAEMIALTSAQNHLGAKLLADCTLYVTAEPCVMCAGALRWSRPRRVVWGADEPKTGYTTVSRAILHPQTEVTRGVLEEECRGLLVDFFRARR